MHIRNKKIETRLKNIETKDEIFKDYPDVVTPGQLQKMLNIGRNTAYKILKNKLVKSIQVGKKYIIPKASVIDFLKTAT